MSKINRINILQADHVGGLSQASIEINIGFEILLFGGRALPSHPPLDSPPKKNQKTHSGDPKNYHLGCLGYTKQHQTKSFEGKIWEKVTFYAKIKHFLPYLALSWFIQLPKL